MPKIENAEFDTRLDIEEIKGIFSSYLSSLSRKVEFGAIPPSDNPFDVPVDFSSYASLFTFGGGLIVQIYIRDLGTHRQVTLAAIGSGAMGRAFHGLRNTVSIGRSRAVAMEVLDRFRNADASITVI